jgi:hypothetical protein
VDANLDGLDDETERRELADERASLQAEADRMRARLAPAPS